MNKNFSSIEETLEFLAKKNPSLKTRAIKYAEQLSKINVSAVQDGAFPDNFNSVCPEQPKIGENKEQNHLNQD